MLESTSYINSTSQFMHALIKYVGLHVWHHVHNPLILELKTQTHLHEWESHSMFLKECSQLLVGLHRG